MGARHRGNWSVYSSQAQTDLMSQRFREAEALLPKVQEAPKFDPMTLEPRQQAALISLMVSHVRTALMQRLLEDSQDPLIGADYRPLRDLGLAEYKEGKRLHDLTMTGRFAAPALEEQLCQKLDVHLMLGPFGTAHTVSYNCPCGWRASVRNSHTAPGNARASFNRHHATAAGMSKLVASLRPPTRAEG